jgi:ADP-ribosylglycohydrolase
MKSTNARWSRRHFLSAAAAAAPLATGATSTAAVPAVGLREKFFGCIAGVYVGSAMGAPVEGWDWERIEKEYSTLDRLLPYHHYGKSNDWTREPGTTEDGVERQKLMILAILDKQDRVNAEDVRTAWVKYMNPKAPGLISEPFEGALLAMAKTPMPAADIGKYCDYSGLVSLSRSCHPIGLINAGDVQGAIEDVRNVGQLYNTANSRGIRWAEVVVTAIAAATNPKATVDSVLGAIFDHCDRPGPFMKEVGVRAELERGLSLTAAGKDFRELRAKLGAVYSGKGIVYSNSYANEVVTKAVCIFRMTSGNTWEAMKAAVNFGRDTDCLAAVSAGISGALSGGLSVPQALIDQVDRATALNHATCVRRGIRETSDGLYNAYRTRLKRMREFAAEMETV